MLKKSAGPFWAFFRCIVFSRRDPTKFAPNSTSSIWCTSTNDNKETSYVEELLGPFGAMFVASGSVTGSHKGPAKLFNFSLVYLDQRQQRTQTMLK